ncbi:MAG: heme ABC transporter permease CcmC [Alphaproteobacteria bacterium]|nr:heme ABC transporter permease CcmC [Alphaproteobacteria bacterium]
MSFSLKSQLIKIFKARHVLGFCDKLLPFAGSIALISLLIGTLWGIFYAPADYQQGDIFRIMYVHVPASWWALGIYMFAATFSVLGLISRIPICFLIAKAFAPIGAGFTVISLITGAIWGKPTWGTWWVWDARLTSMLILLFLYIGYLNLSFKSYNERTLNFASIVLVIGSLNIPIIKWSVDWWYTLHQPASLMRFAKPAIHSSMLWPLLIMALGFGAYALTFGCLNLKFLIQQRQQQRDTIE